MGLNPIDASEKIVDKYLRYIETTFYIQDEEYMNQFKRYLQRKELFAKGPYLDFSDSFEQGSSIERLIEEDYLSTEFLWLYEKKKELLKRPLYKHQELAIKKIGEDKNLVITTGTGSGKTESFLLPIMNYLMRQKEKGILNDGVRALIIYPMNALANDQMKRMRDLLENYSSITFGSYTGETENEDRDALAKYRSLNNGQAPLKNERISRKQIKDNPPHILITNYAMLEYLLLRPEDNIFFHGKYSDEWKYIVLDEAHTYTGATGIEVSMLLRRLKNTLNCNERIRFILTSATLGDEKDNEDICKFASGLCSDENFDGTNIVRAQRFSNFSTKNLKEYPSHVYSDLERLIEKDASIDNITECICAIDSSFICNAENIQELLYDFFVQNIDYYKMREIIKNQAITLKEIAEKMEMNERDLVSLVSVCSKAQKGGIQLLDARYHMFIRALEGAYIVLGKNKRLSISPQNKAYINGEMFRCYKISVCQYCGQIYLEGKIEDSYLVQKKENEDKGINNYYMICKVMPDMLDEKNKESIYNLCGKCGYIEKESLINGNMCKCGKEHIIKVMELSPKNKTLHKCKACGLTNTQGSILRGFYLGQEAATSVIGSSLYEEIPSKMLKKQEIMSNIDNDFFGIDEESSDLEIQESAEEVKKQLLVFSDSRQEAAYFASYFDFTYNNQLKRRLFVKALKEIEESSKCERIEVDNAVQKLALLYERYEVVEADSSLKEAWKTFLSEISSNERNSLENTGLVSFEFKPLMLPKFGNFRNKDADVLQQVLANSFKRDCIFDFPYANEMRTADKEDYLYKGIESTMSMEKHEGEQKTYRKSWISRNNSNVRFDYIRKILKTDNKEDVNRYLEQIWEKWRKDGVLVRNHNDQYLMDISRFNIRTSFSNKIKWYICNKCGRLTIYNINNVCPANRCDGNLCECDPEIELANNHYRKQYLDSDIFTMKVKEHTAQLSAETAKEYQEKFINGKINVLSCSTTFEMGVDVGELETVFMKNVPPTPSNYVQRAGRAGRRKDSVAYSLTFCRLSSHDLTYFKAPTKMIKGKIYPPKFKIENEKIVKRHMNAAIIASFWRKYPETYKNVGAFFKRTNYEILQDYIKELPVEVRQYLDGFVPANLKK